jgi:hypothetical protein
LTQLYRPTLHQIHVLHGPQAGQEVIFTCIADGLAHVARALAPEAAQALRVQLAPERRPRLHSWDARYPLVRSTDLYPVPGHERLRAAFFADQDGTAIVLHFIWHWDGEGDGETFQALRQRLWVPRPIQEGTQDRLPGDLGDGLLLTAVLTDSLDPAENGSSLACEIVVPFERLETPLTRLPLNGATLYAPLQAPLRPATWPAVLLFDRPEVEQTPAADRLATVVWPQVVLYHLRLERLYLDEYREAVEQRLVDQRDELRDELEKTFAPTTDGARRNPEPRLLVRGDLGRMRSALAGLSGPQYGLLDALSDAERCAHHGRRDLGNLEAAVRSALATSLVDAPPAAADIEVSLAEWTHRARHFVAQMEADASEARNLAERAARAVDVLRTQADILEAGYEQRLNVTVTVLGVALAAGQLVTDDLAAWLWAMVVQPRWPPALPPLADPVLERLLIRLLVMLVTGLATWLLVRLYGRLGQ